MARQSWHGTARPAMLQLFSRRGAPITCASTLWLTLIGLSRSQNIHVDWSGGVPHLPHLEEGRPRSGFEPRLIYLVGGYGEERLNIVELYDPQNASWTQLASMRGPRSLHGCVAFQGKLYAVGSLADIQHGGDVLDTAEVYDPQTDDWQPFAKMSTARAVFGLAAVGGKIYAIGGWNGGTTVLDSVEAYDPQLGYWAMVASMSVKRCQHASVVLDGKIYTMGGVQTSHASANLDTVEVYDPQANRWQRVASMPQGRSAFAAAAIGGNIYVTGGSRDGSATSSVCAYDPQADAWTQLATMGTPRHSHAAAAVDGKLYVFGGHYDEEDLDTMEIYDPASDSWAQGTSLAFPRHDLVAVAL